MAEFHLGELSLAPHLRKFLIRCVSPSTSRTTKFGPELCRQLALLVSMQLPLRVDMLPGTETQGVTLVMKVDPDELHTFGGSAAKRARDEVKRYFMKELSHTIDDVSFRAGMPRKQAIQLFLDEFSITEDDYDFRNCEQQYLRYLRKEKRPLRRGRPRKPLKRVKGGRKR